MKLSDISDIAASGLVAQRARMATAASNLANAETTRLQAQRQVRVVAREQEDGLDGLVRRQDHLERAVFGSHHPSLAVDVVARDDPPTDICVQHVRKVKL